MGTNFQAKVSKAKLLPEKDFLKNQTGEQQATGID
jgi:hypothetical protein